MARLLSFAKGTMRSTFALITLLLILGLAFAEDQPTTRPTEMKAATELKVMSYNIRNGNAGDGDNAWPKRAHLFFQTIRAFGPDLLGMQEVIQSQLEESVKALPEYEHVGVAREDGKQAGEYAPIFFRVDRFALIETGNWWLSPTPEVVGSVGWDAALTRIATWAKLIDKRSSETIFVVNTHFDHVGEIARHESAKLLRAKLKDQSGKVIVTGDFNASDGSAPIDAMLEGGFFTDTFREVHSTPTDEEASFHGFSGNIEGKRIDFIFTHGYEIKDATIDRTREGKRCGSDHDAVTATLR